MLGSRKRGMLSAAMSALVLAFLLIAYAPTHSAAQDRTDEGASIRFVQASPDAPALDVIADGAVVASNLAFGAASDYLPMTSGKHQVQIVPTGSTAESAVLDEEVDLDSGDAYIFGTVGLLNDLQSKVFKVDQGDLDENQARVRLINLAPDEDSVDLAVSGGDTWQSNIDFPNASDYKNVDAGTYSVEVRKHDGDTAEVSVSGLSIVANRAYDVLLLGQVSANNLSVLTLETRVSPPCGEVLNVGSSEDGCVRVINASPDSPGLDVYVNDTLVVQNLAYGDSTEFTALPSGKDSEVKVTATGGSLDSAIADHKIDIDTGQAYELLVLNKASDLEIAAAEVDLSPVPADQARIRVIGAAADAPDLDVEITDGPKLFGGIGFKESSDNTIVDASTYDIQFKDGDNVLTRVEGFVVEPNTFYDLVVIGSTDNNTLQVIALSAPTAPIEGASATPESTPAGVDGGLAGTATPDVVSTPGA